MQTLSVCSVCFLYQNLHHYYHPRCMNCKNGWDYDYLTTFLTKTYLTTTYRAHRDQLLLERELSFLPATQPAATHQRQLDDMNEKITELYKAKHALEKQIKDMEAERGRIAARVRRGGYEDDGGEEGTEGTSGNKFQRPCIKEGCKGFLNKAWHCSICDTDVCKNCYVIKEPGQQQHECKEKDVETAKLLKDNTKPCPNCGTGIYKQNGCSQMWCTQCKTAFDWNTGRIETGRIHNPHYYEAIRRMNNGVVPREPGDVPCGGRDNLPPLSSVRRALVKLNPNPSKERMHNERIVYSMHQVVSHVRYNELMRYENTDNNEFNRNLCTRVKYMLNKITLEEMKETLSKQDKLSMKRADIWQVLEMFGNVGADLFRQFEQDYDVQKCIVAFEELRNYTNENMSKVSKKHNCVTPRIQKSELEDYFVERAK